MIPAQVPCTYPAARSSLAQPHSTTISPSSLSVLCHIILLHTPSRFFRRMLDNRDAYSLNIPLACTTTW